VGIEIITNNKDNMQTNKKPSDLSTQLFDVAKSYSDMSRSGQLYGRLDMLLDMKLYLATEEVKIRKQIEESEKKNEPSS
tara:strand:+ start:124 stop:360 length:237 start_codon:yes stop_codon:yes gene_type:complete